MHLTLDDIPFNPSPYDISPPDWETILIISDSLEDQSQDHLANALRWLASNNHWPQQLPTSSPSWVWWFQLRPTVNSYSRYHTSAPRSQEKLAPVWDRSILPSSLLPPGTQATTSIYFASFKSNSLPASLTLFATTIYPPTKENSRCLPSQRS